MNVLEDTYLPDILHDIAQALLGPTMVVIIALIAIALFLLGQVIVEYFTERRFYKQNSARIVNEVNDASYDDLAEVVAKSALLRFQKAALITVTRNMGLPEEALLSLASMQLDVAERRYKKRLAWTDTISKVAPMLGLMGTLIPLGPGIVALGENNVYELSQSLLVAFDATVCGLVVACFCLVLSKVRSIWYSNYTSTLESLMNCVIEKADIARKAGLTLPSGYAGNPLAEFDIANGAQDGLKVREASGKSRRDEAAAASSTRPARSSVDGDASVRAEGAR